MDSANDDRAAVTTTTVLYMWDLKAAWFQFFLTSPPEFPSCCSYRLPMVPFRFSTLLWTIHSFPPTY